LTNNFAIKNFGPLDFSATNNSPSRPWSVIRGPLKVQAVRQPRWINALAWPKPLHPKDKACLVSTHAVPVFSGSAINLNQCPAATPTKRIP